MDRKTHQTIEESERRIAAALDDLMGCPVAPAGGGRTTLVRAAIGSDVVMAEVVGEDAAAELPAPGSMQESEARIAAALSDIDGRPTAAPPRTEVTERSAALDDDAAFHRTLGEAKRLLDVVEARIGRGQGSRHAGGTVDLRELGRGIR